MFSRYEDMANNRAVETGDAAYSSSSDALTEEQEEAELRLALQRMSQGDKKYALRNRYTALFTLLLRMRMACDHPWLVIQGGRKAKDSNVIQGDSAHASLGGRDGATIKNGVRVVPAIGTSEISEEQNLSGLFGQAFLEGLMSKMLQKRDDRRAKEAKQREKRQESTTLPVAQLNAALKLTMPSLKKGSSESPEMWPTVARPALSPLFLPRPSSSSPPACAE